MEPGAPRPSQNAAVLRNKSACLGARPSVIGHSQETRSCHYGNSPGMITEPGGPPRAKDTSHLGRFAIHTTRKRLLNVADCKPFDIKNLGAYERQRWQESTGNG